MKKMCTLYGGQPAMLRNALCPHTHNTKTYMFFCLFFSSPEPLGSQGELIVYA